MNPSGEDAHDNRLVLLCGGEAFFPALIRAIDAARQEIWLETYIFADDDVGRAVENALLRAAARGVGVHVVVDWFGTGVRRTDALRVRFGVAGVAFRCFNPWFRRGFVRLHRKLVVIDGVEAFIGGINLDSDWCTAGRRHRALSAPRWDFAVQVYGPVVVAMRCETAALSHRIGHRDWRERLRLFREWRPHGIRRGLAVEYVQFVVRDNLRNRRTIQQAYQQAIRAARESIWLATPYFAPGRVFCQDLIDAARRGVSVNLLLGTRQYRAQDMVTRALYPQLLRHGVKLYEYRQSELHAKVAVIDDDWATIGSSNCDGLSLFLNQEANLIVRDTEFARALRRRIEQGIDEAVAMQLADYRAIPWFKRSAYRVAAWLYRGAIRIVTPGSLRG